MNRSLPGKWQRKKTSSVDKPRIIFVNRVYWPSTEATAQLLTDLAEGLAARGWHVQVIASGRTAGSRTGVVIHRTGTDEKNRGLASRLVNYLGHAFAARRILRAIIQPGDRVVVMTDPPLLNTLIARLAQRHGGEVIHWVQDIYPEILATRLGAWSRSLLFPLRLLRNMAWRSARHCVTLGTDMASLITANGYPAEKVVIIPNWAPRELSALPTDSQVAEQRQQWALADKFIVAYSGNLGRVHEFATIIGTAELLREEASIAFVFIGQGARFGEVRRMAAEKRLTNVFFLPPAPREQLALSLASADAQLVTINPDFSQLVYPSKLAGVLAAGRPVLLVGPAQGELAKLLQQNGCGAAFCPAESRQLAQTLVGWQADPARRLQIGRQARTLYEQHYAFSSTLELWEKVLEKHAGEVIAEPASSDL